MIGRRYLSSESEKRPTHNYTPAGTQYTTATSSQFAPRPTQLRRVPWDCLRVAHGKILATVAIGKN